MVERQKLATLLKESKKMKPVTFFKMSGSGNDFIILDNRKRIIDDSDLPAIIPYHNSFAPSGTNVNFISPQQNRKLSIRT